MTSFVFRIKAFWVPLCLWVFICSINSTSAQSLQSSPSPSALTSPVTPPADLDHQSGQDIAVDSVELLLEQIRQVEATKSSFDQELGELSFDLGVQLASLGLHEEALEAFQRADQIMKVREGLYSDNREVVIRKIFEQHVALNDWESAEVAMDSNAWLKARNVDANTLAYVDVLQELVRWNLAREHYRIEDEDSRPLLRAYSDLEKIFKIYDSYGMPLDDRTLDLAMTVNHLLSLEITVMDVTVDRVGVQTQAIDRRYYRQAQAAVSACESFYTDDEALRDSCIQAAERHIHQSLPETIYLDYSSETGFDQEVAFYSRSYFRGKDLLLDQIELLQEIDDDPRTLDALLKLGDWYLLFGYQSSAEEVYVAAWNFAKEIGMEDSIYMQEPIAISSAAVVETLPKLVVGKHEGEAELAVTITKNGEIEKIEYLDTDIADERVIADLSASLASSRYRPILREGVPIAAVAYTLSKQVTY